MQNHGVEDYQECRVTSGSDDRDGSYTFLGVKTQVAFLFPTPLLTLHMSFVKLSIFGTSFEVSFRVPLRYTVELPFHTGNHSIC
jgi:hypothetical protein